MFEASQSAAYYYAAGFSCRLIAKKREKGEFCTSGTVIAC